MLLMLCKTSTFNICGIFYKKIQHDSVVYQHLCFRLSFIREILNLKKDMQSIKFNRK